MQHNNIFFSKEKQDGYFPKELSEMAIGQTVKDLKHFYHLYFPWGRYPQEVSNKAKIYFEQAFELGKTLMNWIEEHMDPAVKERLSQDFSKMLSFDRTLLRIMQQNIKKRVQFERQLMKILILSQFYQ